MDNYACKGTHLWIFVLKQANFIRVLSKLTKDTEKYTKIRSLEW